MENTSLQLLLADADDGKETLEGGLPLESAANEPPLDAWNHAERRAAKRHGVPREELRQWVTAHQACGRNALNEKR